MATIADLIIKLGVNDSGVSSTLERAGQSATKLGGKLAAVGKTAALVAGAAGIGGLVYTLKTGYGEWSDSTKVAAQTAATIKSTGDAAHVTAGHVDALANSILSKSGIDDEAVKSGENMLLTFTGIRNEVGKGNDIFDQATHAVTDMDVAMTHGNSTAQSLSKTAILVGKALNDPIKGATALRRVGVSLTDAQQKQIAAFVKSGDVMSAQKIVLGELNKEFGGSAEAMGKTLPGQISILRENFNNLAGDLFTKLVPSLTSVLTWVDTHWPQISAVFGAVFGALGAVIQDVVVPVLAFLIQKGQEVVAWFQAHWGEISAKAEAVFNAIAPKAKAALSTLDAIIRGAVTVIEAFWDRFGSTIMATLRNAFAAITAVVKGAMQVIEGVVNVVGGLIHGDWSRVWKGIQEIFSGVWTAISGILKADLNEMKAVLSAALGAIAALIRGAASSALSAAESFGKAIYNGIASGLKTLGSDLVSWIVAPINAIIGRIDSIKISVPKVHIPLVGDVGGGSYGFNIPTLAIGTTSVYSDGLAYLHAGEAVVPANVAAGGWSGGGGGGGDGDVILQVDGRELIRFARQELNRTGTRNARPAIA